MATNYWGDDDFDRGRGRRFDPRNDPYLNAGGAGGYRGRSPSQPPVVPQVNVYNRIENDQDHYPPYPPARSPRASPRRYSHYRLGDDLVEDLAEMSLERRERSRSRARPDYAAYDRQAAYEAGEREARLRDAEARLQRERDEERIRNEMRYKHMHEEEIQKLEKQRAEDEFKAKMMAADLKRKQEKAEEEEREKRYADDYERKMREKKEKEKAEEQRIKDEIARKAREKKEEEERLWREYELKKKEEKEKHEADLREAARELKEREDKKKEEEKEAEEKLQQEMRARLRASGFSDDAINVIIDKEKAKKHQISIEQRTELSVYRPASKVPVFPKVRREYIEIETLKYFGLPWEYDRNDPNYIIILRDMDKEDTDLLFEHSQKIRSGVLLIEGHKKKQPEYAFYRKRSKSRHGHDRVGILEFKR